MSNEPAWFTSAVDQRLALLEHKLKPSDIATTDLIFTLLKEPTEDATADAVIKWERTCDGCGTYIPPAAMTSFYTGTVIKQLKSGKRVYLTFGVCKLCAWT